MIPVTELSAKARAPISSTPSGSTTSPSDTSPLKASSSIVLSDSGNLNAASPSESARAAIPLFASRIHKTKTPAKSLRICLMLNTSFFWGEMAKAGSS